MVLVPLLAACGGAQVGDPTATVGVANTPTTITAATTATPVVPNMPSGLCMGEQPVIDEFSVWQDFMPSVSRDGAPLHATLTLDIDWPEKIVASSTGGSITLLRAGEAELVTADLQLNQAVDDLGMGQPGPQKLTFIMVPTVVSTQLVEGEPLHGTAGLTINDTPVSCVLPVTALLFTH